MRAKEWLAVSTVISSTPYTFLSHRHASCYQWFSNIETGLSEFPIPLIPVTQKRDQFGSRAEGQCLA
jgi:hypothetical protein